MEIPNSSDPEGDPELAPFLENRYRGSEPPYRFAFSLRTLLIASLALGVIACLWNPPGSQISAVVAKRFIPAGTRLTDDRIGELAQVGARLPWELFGKPTAASSLAQLKDKCLVRDISANGVFELRYLRSAIPATEYPRPSNYYPNDCDHRRQYNSENIEVLLAQFEVNPLFKAAARRRCKGTYQVCALLDYVPVERDEAKFIVRVHPSTEYDSRSSICLMPETISIHASVSPTLQATIRSVESY